MEAPVAAAFVSASIAAGVGLGTWLSTYVINQTNLREKQRSEKRAAIAKKLNEFYGPLQSRLGVVLALYSIFKANKPKGFRTLTYLLHPEQEYLHEGRAQIVELTDSDKELLKEIIKIEEGIENLINRKAGLIDDEELIAPYRPAAPDGGIYPDGTSLLAALVAHIRILRLAHAGHFRGEVDRFSQYVYPRDIDQRIATKRKALADQLDTMVGAKRLAP